LDVGQASIIKFGDHVFIATVAYRPIAIATGKARCVVFTSGNKNDEEIGVVRARYEMFGAVQNPVTAIGPRPSSRSTNVNSTCERPAPPTLSGEFQAQAPRLMAFLFDIGGDFGGHFAAALDRVFMRVNLVFDKALHGRVGSFPARLLSQNPC